MQAFTQQIQPYLDQLKDLGWIGILAYAAAIVILQLIGVPLSPFGIAAGGLFGFRNGLLAITLGTNVGAALNFLIARYFARTMVTHWLGHHEKFRLIDRAIARGTGAAGSDDVVELTYEGYGPNGVAVMVECMTDNRNRTAAAVRHAFSKCGGNLGTDGSVAYLFERKGQIIVNGPAE